MITNGKLAHEIAKDYDIALPDAINIVLRVCEAIAETITPKDSEPVEKRSNHGRRKKRRPLSETTDRRNP